jgi:hypothetical protein
VLSTLAVSASGVPLGLLAQQVWVRDPAEHRQRHRPRQQALWCVHHQQTTPPEHPPSLREAVCWIAQLGGFLARTGDGDPRLQTLGVAGNA